MPGKSFLALLVCFETGFVCLRRIVFQPGEQGGAKVGANAGVVVYYLPDESGFIKYARCAVGCIALRGDAFIPVMIRIGGLLALHRLQPGIFPWRLVEVRVNTDTA